MKKIIIILITLLFFSCDKDGLCTYDLKETYIVSGSFFSLLSQSECGLETNITIEEELNLIHIANCDTIISMPILRDNWFIIPADIIIGPYEAKQYRNYYFDYTDQGVTIIGSVSSNIDHVAIFEER